MYLCMSYRTLLCQAGGGRVMALASALIAEAAGDYERCMNKLVFDR
jgi:hypothetical protein